MNYTPAAVSPLPSQRGIQEVDEQMHVHEVPSEIVPSYSEAPDQSDLNLTALEGALDHATIEFSLADDDVALTPLG